MIQTFLWEPTWRFYTRISKPLLLILTCSLFSSMRKSSCGLAEGLETAVIKT